MLGFGARDEQRLVVVQHRERNRLGQFIARALQQRLGELRDPVAPDAGAAQPAKPGQRAELASGMFDIAQFGQRDQASPRGGACRAGCARRVRDAHHAMDRERLDDGEALGEAPHAFAVSSRSGCRIHAAMVALTVILKRSNLFDIEIMFGIRTLVICCQTKSSVRACVPTRPFYDAAETHEAAAFGRPDPGAVLGVPDRGDLRQEQERIFQGPTWHYLALEVELPEAGDFRTTYVGDTPVVVVRDADGEIYAFENRCAHRGALICAGESRQGQKDFSCVYHAWSYDRQGDLTGVAFKNGVKGKGGMPETFCMEEHGPRKLRIAILHGLVFGIFSEDVPPIEEYLGDEICSAHRARAGGRKPVVLGRFTQALPNNWKLYVENVKDSYHASLLHLFFTTFELNRLSQKGGIIVDESGGHHVSYSVIDPTRRRTPSTKQQPALGKPVPARRPERCWTASTNTTTASRCRSSRCSRASCCSRSRTPRRAPDRAARASTRPI